MAENTGKKIYIGIDLDADVSMVSFAYEGCEPETVSPMAGSEIFAIPLAICLKKNGGWAYGEEARRVAKSGLGQCEEHLLERALRGEQVQVGEKLYAVSDLLAMFLKKMVMMAGRLEPAVQLHCLVITTRVLDVPMIRLLQECVKTMQLTDTAVHFMDHKESFFYYGSNQPSEFSAHDMGLFEYRNRQMQFWCLEREKMTRPQLFSIREERYSFDVQQGDEVFTRIIPQAFGKHIITTVYLVGDGFENGWMKQSLQLLCQGRRVFLGKNLYSKGACFAAMRMVDTSPKRSVYIGEHEMKCNVSLKVYERGNLSFFTLVTAGIPWFEAQGSCEVIIDGTPTIDFWIQQPNSREARIETVSLGALPERENRTTRMIIDAVPTSDHEVLVKLTDIGLGELVPGTGKKWEYQLQL
ncbi:MAG: DUF5716 family protein [Lachnospiraceae bacterium]|nr:DUF5716 family protein [Lachnospiraceae bacterium]